MIDKPLLLELAGISKDKLSVEIDGDFLCINADKQYTHDPEKSDWVTRRSERSFGKISRRFRLPNYVDKDSVKTCFCDGLLKVHFNKVGPGAVGYKKLMIE